MQVFTGLVVSIFLVFSTAYAGDGKKKSNSLDAIKDAMSKSNEDQEAMRDRVYEENVDKINQWDQRENGAIEIQSHGSVGGSETFDRGVDSGIGNFKPKFEKENTDVNFDSELKEVEKEKKDTNPAKPD